MPQNYQQARPKLSRAQVHETRDTYITSLGPRIEMLELKGWAINSDRKMSFCRGIFHSGEKAKERSRRLIFENNFKPERRFLCPKEETEVRGEGFLSPHGALLLLFSLTKRLRLSGNNVGLWC